VDEDERESEERVRIIRDCLSRGISPEQIVHIHPEPGLSKPVIWENGATGAPDKTKGRSDKCGNAPYDSFVRMRFGFNQVHRLNAVPLEAAVQAMPRATPS
jgi:hypothetical protein